MQEYGIDSYVPTPEIVINVFLILTGIDNY